MFVLIRKYNETIVEPTKNSVSFKLEIEY